jgi:DNA (cytosine-5)-methyltransferase 1
MCEENIKVVELFAGVGGFRRGLENQSNRFKTIWANQWEPGKKSQHAFNCYVQRFPNEGIKVNADISLVKAEIPKHDLLVGGFPCQDYSVAATGAKGIEGKKGVLWWQINDILTALRPPFVLLENVDRLLKSPARQRGRDFAVMLRCFHDLGYDVEWRVINAAEYGYAQRRRRVFIFAYHRTTNYFGKLVNLTKTVDLSEIVYKHGIFAKAFPIKSSESTIKNKTVIFNIYEDFEDLIAVSDDFNKLLYNSGILCQGKVFSEEVFAKLKQPVTLREIRHTEEVDSKYFLDGKLDKWKYLKGSKRIERKKPNGETYFYSEGGMSFPDPLDLPGRTLLTSESSVNRSTHVIEDYITGNLRLLTPIECELLNGFPANWTNTGMPEKFRYFTMGNALVVPIVERLGEEIVKIFDMK